MKRTHRKPKLLVIDDDAAFVTLFRRRQHSRFEIVAESSISNGIELLKKAHFDAVLIDLLWQDDTTAGLDILKNATQTRQDSLYYILTGYDSSQSAIEAIRLGAKDYIIKPTSPSEFDAIGDRLLEDVTGKQESRPSLQAHFGSDFGNLVGESDGIKQVRAQIATYGRQGTNNVLITGENGAGKEVVAQALHASAISYGTNRDRTFLAVNLGETRGDHLQSSLFGHVRGSFTGATRNKEGFFRAAGSGTLFLDEIGELPFDDQARLLRAIETRRATPLGGEQNYPIEANLVFATNRNLQEEVELNRFRQDLYFRISAFCINVPPLRERLSDIPLLASHFITKLNDSYNRKVTGMDAASLDALQAHNWPGNIRELYNLIHKAFVEMDSGATTLRLKDLPGKRFYKVGLTTAQWHKKLNAYLRAYHQNDRKYRKAARALGVADSSVRRPLNGLFKHHPHLKSKYSPIPISYVQKETN